MHKVIYLVLLVGSALWFCSGIPSFPSIQEGPLEESKKWAQLEQMQLADPTTGLIPRNARAGDLEYYNAVFGNAKQYRNSSWVQAGPYNVGGRTREAKIDVTNENIIIAAGVSGGIWRTTNGGQSWIRVSDTTKLMGAVSLTQDTRPGKQNIWYALTGEGYGNSASAAGAYYLGDGVFKSTDSGKSWAPLPSTAGGVPSGFSTNWQVGWRIVTHPRQDSDIVFVAAYGLIYRSNNGGNTWNAALGNPSNASYATDIAITTDGTIYATISSDGNTKGFYRSTDAGISWTNITPTSLLTNYDRTVIGINPNNENQILFFSMLADSTNVGGTSTSNFYGDKEYISLLKYDNAIEAWTDLSANLPNNANVTTGPFDKLNLQGGYNMCVKIQPGTNHVIIGGTNLYISTDGFTSKNNFRQIGGYKIGTGLPRFEIYPGHHPDNHDIQFFKSNPKKVLSICDGGLYVIDDINASTTQWRSLNNGYYTTQVYAVTMSPTAGNNYIHAGFQDNGNFVNPNYKEATKPWVMPYNGDGGYGYIAKDNNFFVMSIQEGRMGKLTLDQNGNRKDFRRIDPIGATRDDYLFINPFAVDPNNQDLMYVPAGKKLFRQSQLTTLPLDNKYDSISTGYFKFSDTIKTLNSSSGFPAQITCIAVSKKPANIVYFGTTRKDIYKVENANTGDPKFTLISKNPIQSGYVSGIAIDPEDANKILVCLSNYNLYSLYYTEDGGVNWKYCGGNLDKNLNFTNTGPSIRAVGILKTPSGGRRYFAATSIGLYSTDTLKGSDAPTKDSTVWQQESPGGIATTVVTSLYIRQSDYVVAAGTHGNGVYISQYYPAPIVVPSNYNLTVYPNPATTEVFLKLTLTEPTNIQYKLFDALGKVVYQKGPQQYPFGEHKITIPTAAYNTGIYFLVYTDDKNRRSKNRILIIN